MNDASYRLTLVNFITGFPGGSKFKRERERERKCNYPEKNDNQYDILPLSKVCAYTSVLTGPVPLALNA